MGKFAEAACEMGVVVWGMLYHWLRSCLLFFLPTPLLAKDISGHLVLITGAGSGIGRLLALEFSALNCRLVLWDVNEEGNRETARLVRDMGAVVKTYRVDVSDRQQVYKAAAQVTSEVGAVDILVNNAGIVTGRKFLECPDSMIAKTMAVNTLAHFWTTKAFLPAMLSRDHGHVVSIASSAGLLGVTGLADYCSSKFAAVGFDEALRLELQTHGKTGVHTTVVSMVTECSGTGRRGQRGGASSGEEPGDAGPAQTPLRLPGSQGDSTHEVSSGDLLLPGGVQPDGPFPGQRARSAPAVMRPMIP